MALSPSNSSNLEQLALKGLMRAVQNREWVDGSWVMGQMGHENQMGHMGHGSLGVDP